MSGTICHCGENAIVSTVVSYLEPGLCRVPQFNFGIDTVLNIPCVCTFVIRTLVSTKPLEIGCLFLQRSANILVNNISNLRIGIDNLIKSLFSIRFKIAEL